MERRRQFAVVVSKVAIASVLINGIFVGLSLYTYSPIGYGATWLQFLIIFPMMLFLAAAILIVLSIGGLVLKKRRRSALKVLACCMVYVLLGLAILQIDGLLFRSAFHGLAIRSKPLVEAIHRFNREQGRPPNSLEELVPAYISEVPSTGMPAYGGYEYSTGDGMELYGNPWILFVNTPSGGVNFDRFIYLPDENYPDEAYGGPLEPIGQWAYVHE